MLSFVNNKLSFGTYPSTAFRLGLEEEFDCLDFQFRAKEWSDSYAVNFFLPQSVKLSTLGQDSFPVKGTKKKAVEENHCLPENLLKKVKIQYCQLPFPCPQIFS